MSGSPRPGDAVLSEELKDTRARYALPRGELRDGKKGFRCSATRFWHAPILADNILSFDKK
jgi:hypothetical protein